MTDYDPKTCVTAEELRAMGVVFDADVPDCAWVPRASLVPDPGSCVLKADEPWLKARIRVGPRFKWWLEQDAGHPLPDAFNTNVTVLEPADVWVICPVCGWMDGPNPEATDCGSPTCPSFDAPLRIVALARSVGYQWFQYKPEARLAALALVDEGLKKGKDE